MEPLAQMKTPGDQPGAPFSGLHGHISAPNAESIAVGRMIASCGHECTEVIDVSYRGETRDCQPCVVHAVYCPSCAADLATRPEFIKPSDSADAGAAP